MEPTQYILYDIVDCLIDLLGTQTILASLLLVGVADMKVLLNRHSLNVNVFFSSNTSDTATLYF